MIQTNIDLSKIKIINSNINTNSGIHQKEVLGLIKVWCNEKKITYNFSGVRNRKAYFSFLNNQEMNQFNEEWKK